MISNLERYKKDLDALLAQGELLHLAIQAECFPDNFANALKKAHGDKAKAVAKSLPRFNEEYQTWYSETKALVRQLLPDRLDDLVRLFQKPKPRKNITFDTYRIEDCLQGLTVTLGWEKEKVVGPEAAIPHFRQQLAILKAVRSRFNSSLFDIRQLVQADLLDSELEAATELVRNGFGRAAGAVAGVVLEKHLSEVASNHGITITKKSPTIADLNDSLKAADVIDVPQWRLIQHLGDIRNLCDHNKKAEPTAEQVTDLIAGVTKTTKTLF